MAFGTLKAIKKKQAYEKKILSKLRNIGPGFSACAENYRAFTTGKTSAELVSNMVESLNLYFEDQELKNCFSKRSHF